MRKLLGNKEISRYFFEKRSWIIFWSKKS